MRTTDSKRRRQRAPWEAPLPVAKPLLPSFPRIDLDFLENYFPAACGSLLMVAGIQYFVPQEPVVYLVMAGVAFVAGIIVSAMKAYRRMHG